jgi:hypothetical protein
MTANRIRAELAEMNEQLAVHLADVSVLEAPAPPAWLAELMDCYYQATMPLVGWAGYPLSQEVKSSMERLCGMVATATLFLAKLYQRWPNADDMQTLLNTPDASKESMESAAGWVARLSHAYHRYFPGKYPQSDALGSELPEQIAIQLALEDGRLSKEDLP